MPRPTLNELIDAISQHLDDQVLPALKGNARLHFQTLVAANVLRIVQREIDLSPQNTQAAWAGLNALLHDNEPAPADAHLLSQRIVIRHAALCQAIRSGVWDDEDASARLMEWLMMVAELELEISNPKFLAALRVEDAARE